MARRTSKRKQPGSDDLSVLHPDRTVTIAGRAVTVREYGFIESLDLMPFLEPIIADLRAVLEGEAPMPGSEQVPPCLARHAQAVAHLMAVATDTELAWIEGLSPSDGHALLWWWWAVNGPFCMRAASERIALAKAIAAARGGPTSSPSSSGPDTATPPPSAG